MKKKLCYKILKAYQVRYKSNFDNIFKSELSYYDLESLGNSFGYFERLQFF